MSANHCSSKLYHLLTNSAAMMAMHGAPSRTIWPAREPSDGAKTALLVYLTLTAGSTLPLLSGTGKSEHFFSSIALATFANGRVVAISKSVSLVSPTLKVFTARVSKNAISTSTTRLPTRT